MKKSNGKSKAVFEESKAYVATATTQRIKRPKDGLSSDRYMRHIVHRELVGSVNGTVAFHATGYDLNPGIAATFPWLSTQATGWEQYRFNRLRFEYITRCATSTVGSVILSPEYDPTDPPPTSESQATNAMDTVEDAVWKNITAELTPAAMFPLGPRKFIRSARVSGDPRTFDAGTFFLCTVEETGTDAIGKLWVEYDVDLFVPQTAVSGAIGTETTFALIQADQTCVTTVATDVEWKAPINDACHWYTADAKQTTFTPPAGAYNVSVVAEVADSVAETFTAYLTMLVDGAVVHGGYMTITAIANGPLSLPFQWYVGLNGTSTVKFQITLTGAAGVLHLGALTTLKVELA